MCFKTLQKTTQEQETNLELRLTNIPPPPPGFEDSGDEFYLDKPEASASVGGGESAAVLNEAMNLSDEEEVEHQGQVLLRTGTCSFNTSRVEPKGARQLES